MQIKSISNFILNRTNNTTNTKNETPIQSGNSTNPFGASFNRNIITADVFENAQKSVMSGKIGEQIIQKASSMMNTVVGKINSWNDGIHTGMSRAAKYMADLKETGIDFINFLRDSRLTINIKDPKNLMKLDLANNAYSVKNLQKRPVGELRTELAELLAA